MKRLPFHKDGEMFTALKDCEQIVQQHNNNKSERKIAKNSDKYKYLKPPAWALEYGDKISNYVLTFYRLVYCESNWQISHL